MEGPAPRVGVGALILRDGLILLGRRIGAHGAGTWSPPGGHLDYGESIEACAARETLEESGLAITGLTRGPYTTDVFEAERKHYVTLFVIAASAHGEPRVMEPTLCEQWAWFSWDALPQPLFAPLESLVNTGFDPRT